MFIYAKHISKMFKPTLLGYSFCIDIAIDLHKMLYNNAKVSILSKYG